VCVCVCVCVCAFKHMHVCVFRGVAVFDHWCVSSLIDCLRVVSLFGTELLLRSFSYTRLVLVVLWRMGGCVGLFPEEHSALRLTLKMLETKKLGGWGREGLMWGKQNNVDLTQTRSGDLWLISICTKVQYFDISLYLWITGCFTVCKSKSLILFKAYFSLRLLHLMLNKYLVLQVS